MSTIAPPIQPTTSSGSSTLVVNQWRRYGKHRLYVSTTDGAPVGWVDIASGERYLDRPDMAIAFEAAIARERASTEPADLPRRAVAEPPAARQARLTTGTPPPPRRAFWPADGTPGSPSEVKWTDLARNVPGQAARARATEELTAMRERKGILMTFVARSLDMKTEERSWRIGAEGEESVGLRLEKLRSKGWKTLHSVPIGDQGSDIDHVLIGPGGVYTLNTKTHPRGEVWVGRNTVLVNGHRQDYLRNSRHEAGRASKLLSAAAGFPVQAIPALVFLTGTVIPQVTVKSEPDGVLILDRLDIPKYFRHRPERLSTEQVELIYEQARRSSTWTNQT